MNKLSKRAISILVIATFLMSMIPIMPAQADMGTIYVSGYPKITDYPVTETLTWSGDATAGYVSPPTYPVLSGETSIRLTTGSLGGASAGRVEIAINPILLQDLDDDPTFWVYEPALQTYGGSYDPLTGQPIPTELYPYGHPYINILIDLDGNLATTSDIDKMEGLGSMTTGGGHPAADTWTKMQENWGYYDMDNSTGSNFYGFTIDPTRIWVGTLAEWKTYMATAYPNAKVVGIQVTYGFWSITSLGPVYVDDMVCAGQLCTTEDVGVDQGDILTVSGSGVTSGAAVNVYWDYVNTEGLINNTVAKPGGTYEVDLEIPSDLPGNHYIWVKDVGTGETNMYPTPIFVLPKLSLSPKSGLVGDEVTAKGYGFSDENEVTIIWDSAVTPVTLTSTLETDEDGYFTYKFDVPTGATYKEYDVTATDDAGWTATFTFTVGASLTLDKEKGPEGTVIEISGEGFTAGALPPVKWNGAPMTIIGDPVTIPSSGEFTVEVVAPSSGKGEHTITIYDTAHTKEVEADFDVDGVATIKVTPTYGTPGATITVTGSNFTQIADTEIDIDLWLDGTTNFVAHLVTAETDSDGSFEETFVSPAVTFDPYDVGAVDTVYDLTADDDFKVGLIALIINPKSGGAGTKTSITGIGFSKGEYNVTFTSSDKSYTKLYEEYGTVTTGEAISDDFWVPNCEPGTYTLTVTDEDENEKSEIFLVTESTYVKVSPSVAPNNYNVSLKGYNFADITDGEVEFVIYNVTSEGEVDLEETMEVNTLTSTSTDPIDGDPTETDKDGNFTGHWHVLLKDVMSLGDYTINVTGSKGLLVQIPFSVVAARVSVAPRKAQFDRGDMIQFDINNDFVLKSSYIEIYSPSDILYWSTDLFIETWWMPTDGLHTVPYYRQTAAANPMELQSDAPMGTWLYIFFDGDEEQLMNGTFAVGPSTAAQVDQLMEDVMSEIAGLTDDMTGMSDDFADEMAALSEGFADDMAGLSDDFADDIAGLANDIAQATDAGQSALDAVGDLADSMTDLGEAVSDIADIASDTSEAVQSAADAANDAVQAANDAQESASGLTGLVYGAIGASLIAALAAIISLMQISRRIAG